METGTNTRRTAATRPREAAGPWPCRLSLAGAIACLALSVGLAVEASAGAGPPATTYELHVRVQPENGTLDVRVQIDKPRTGSFSLARDLAVRSVLADGKAVEYRERPGDGSEGGASRELTITGPVPQRLVVEYGGALRAESYPKLISLVNGVRPRLVELAGYVGWFPRLSGSPGFCWRMSVDLPAGFVPVTSGRLVASATKGDRVVSEWQSRAASGDIVLAAAPGMRTTRATRSGVSVELVSSALPQDYLDAMNADVARALDEISALVGRPSPTDVVRVLYSPRPGWGYVRTPLIIVSEESALAHRAQDLGPARDLRYIAHEVAHYWWHQADTGSPEDWINEGLAEYSAFLAMERIVGPAFAAKLLSEAEERSANGATTVAIASTPNGHADRELNRYTRPLLLLEAARRRRGDAAMRAFLRALDTRFVTAGMATTAAFLSVVEAQLGADERARFAEALFRSEWAPAGPRSTYSPGDAGFLGTWRGRLTQGSETHLVVLHLAVKDDTLVASIDSPDQGVTGIPLPAVRIADDLLHFAIGSVGVDFAGHKRPDSAVIEGEWKQGGTAVPLVLEKADGR